MAARVAGTRSGGGNRRGWGTIPSGERGRDDYRPWYYSFLWVFVATTRLGRVRGARSRGVAVGLS
ncbi:MAG: hypothetical protein V1816_15050 [Pseudomonadota bacterium]